MDNSKQVLKYIMILQAMYVLIESQICQWYLASLRQSVVFFLENESSSCQLPETHTAEISKCHWTSQARTYPALIKFYPHISFLFRLHFLNLRRPDKHNDVFDQHVYKGGHGGWQKLHWNWDNSSKWEFKLLCDLATKEKGAIITFAMIQPKIEN